MEKKITVQFKANTRLKPKKIVWNENMENAYPLYVSVIYNGSNTDFKAEINGEMVLVTEDLAQLETPGLSNSIAKYERFIYNVIKTEIEIKEGEFSFSGFGNRIKVYSNSVQSIFASISIEEMFELVEAHLFSVGGDYDSEELFSRIIELYSQLAKYNVFEWQYGQDEDDFIHWLDIKPGDQSISGIAHQFICDMVYKSLE